jgi:hypothetical protein
MELPLLYGGAPEKYFRDVSLGFAKQMGVDN